MDQFSLPKKLKSPLDRIEGDTVFLDFEGCFPKKLILVDGCQRKQGEYRIVKSVSGRFQLNK
ncbi:MAG: hypothetical protein ABSH06_05100 [Thermodesulfobacteriota bacterium]